MKVEELTVEEKIKMLTGKGGFETQDLDGKLKRYILADGPHGVKVVDVQTASDRNKATAFPCMQNLGNSWDEESARLMGNVIAEDCILNGVDIILAPGINIKRVAVCGRNFEYISEDPLLAGRLAKWFVRGVQEKGIGATAKHFCANNREYARQTVSSEVDERTLREVYLRAFQIVIEEKPWLVMCSYNPVNGWYTSENKWLLKDVLRDELGFDGVIVSDWQAVHDRAKSLKATLDLEMPYASGSEENLKSALKRGFITEKEIDESVARLLQLFEKIETNRSLRKVEMSDEERHNVAVKVSEESIVLLKNDSDILPLKGSKKIAVIGELAQKPEMGGGGSSDMSGFCEYKPIGLATLLSERLPNSKVKYYNAYKNYGHRDSDLFGKIAIMAAYESDIAIVCVGNNSKIESECFDRENIHLPAIHEDIIDRVCEVNENVVVIVTAGSCIDMRRFKDKVKAIIYTGFAGEVGNEALANILVGRVCPSGKLSETFINSMEDNPNNTFVGNGFVEKYNDGINVGYKYYLRNKIPVQFPFGYGLSYAKFEYSDLTIEKRGETEYLVSYNVSNLSDIEAKEVSQVYVKDVFAMVDVPEMSLAAFAKTSLKGGETKRVSHLLKKDAFAYYSTVLKDWYVENGYFEIYIGASSQDIRLKGKIMIEQNEDDQNSKYDDYYLNL